MVFLHENLASRGLNLLDRLVDVVDTNRVLESKTPSVSDRGFYKSIKSILAVFYSPYLSSIDVWGGVELNYRVRDGIGCLLL